MKLLYRLFCFSYRVQRLLVRRFTPGGLAILVCLLAAAVIGLDTKQTMAYQVFAFLLAVLIMAIAHSTLTEIVLGFDSRWRFGAVRTLPKFATVGIKLTYPITISNQTKQLQSGLKFTEEIAIPKFGLREFRQIINSTTKNRKVNSITYIYYRWLKAIAQKRKAKTRAIDLPVLKPKSETKIRGEITPTHRGVIRLAGITILRADPFNLFNVVTSISLPQSLLVLPQRYQLPRINLPGSRMSQSGTVSLAASVGDSEEFMSLRDYRPGDPLRKIHWKSWAKTDKPVVKEEKSEYFVRQALVLDTFQPQSKNKNISEILEAAVSLAASFAWDVHTQESLLDLMFVGLESYCFTTGRGLGSSEQMLEILAGVTACQDKTFDYLATALKSKTSMLSGCICILITWDEERKKLVEYLQKFKIPHLILLLAELEQEYSQLKVENLYILPLEKLQESLLAIESGY
jgi:uncharacterized protein (DUF58 family)